MAHGKRMNGEIPFILGYERPMVPFVSSSMCKSWMDIDRHLIPFGGRMGGPGWVPPSMTIMSLSISVRENLYCVVGTIISLNMASCFIRLFFERRIRRWMTRGFIAWTSAAAAHWVRTEEFADDLEKTWTHGGLGWEYPYLEKWLPWCTLFDSDKKSTVWQLDPHATNDKGSQWTLSLITLDKERQWATREVRSLIWLHFIETLTTKKGGPEFLGDLSCPLR